MRILLGAQHRYPAFREAGIEFRPATQVLGTEQHIHDLLARGLAELGHEVYYLLPQGAEASLPSSVKLCTVPPVDVDVAHGIARKDALLRGIRYRTPYVTTCHAVPATKPKADDPNDANWIFTSRFLAHKCAGTKFVYNGIDPDGYSFRAEKEDYLLFMANLDHYKEKGLPLALQIASKAGRRLVVAGGASEASRIGEIKQICSKANASYVGDVRGRTKAALIAGAQALLVTGTQTDGGPLIIPESLISGTPVLAFGTGACPELLPAECGALCTSEADFLKALDSITLWEPVTCRRTALTKFHYLRMARDYVPLYRQEINRFREQMTREAGADDTRDEDDGSSFG